MCRYMGERPRWCTSTECARSTRGVVHARQDFRYGGPDCGRARCRSALQPMPCFLDPSLLQQSRCPVILSPEIAPLRGTLVPFCGRGAISWPAPALLATAAHQIHGAGMSLLGGFEVVRICLSGSASNASTIQIHMHEIVLGQEWPNAAAR